MLRSAECRIELLGIKQKPAKTFKGALHSSELIHTDENRNHMQSLISVNP
jgi:hypothetical protein